MIKLFGKTYDNFNDWFYYKNNHHSKIDWHKLLMDFLWLTAFIILFLVFYNNSIIFNQIVILFIRLGAIIQLTLLYFIIRKGYAFIVNIKRGIVGLNNGYKFGLLLVLILICAIIYANQGTFTTNALDLYENFNFASFNPFKLPN